MIQTEFECLCPVCELHYTSKKIKDFTMLDYEFYNTFGFMVKVCNTKKCRI